MTEQKTCKTTTVTQNLSLDVAAVAVELANALRATRESLWPGKYYYEMFDGFPGWWRFCAEAGEAFSAAYEHGQSLQPDTDFDFVGCVDRYAESVIKTLLGSGYVTGKENLRELADLAIQQPL